MNGRERRRRGFYGTVRRVIYGVLLYCAVPYAAAAGQAVHTAKHHTPSASRAVAATQTSDDWLFLGVAGPDGDRSLAYGELAARTSLGELSVHQFSLTAAGNLLKAAQLTDDIDAVRKGLGVDLTLPGIGNVYLDLYSAREAQAGKRWKLSTDEDDAPRPASKTWSLGGSVELVKTAQGRTVVLVPQLIVDVDALFGVQGQFEAGFQYAHWQGAAKRSVLDERVAQATVRWQF